MEKITFNFKIRKSLLSEGFYIIAVSSDFSIYKCFICCIEKEAEANKILKENKKIYLSILKKMI